MTLPDSGRTAGAAEPAAGRRPLIVIPGRFSASASALRYAAVVTAQALAEAVYAAGGEPLTVLPADLAHAREPGDRFAFADGVLLPGGGDLAPASYGEPVASGEVYDVDERQDATDLALARSLAAGDVPFLAVCRGMQVLNVALGGSLHQHMSSPHRHTVRQLSVEPGSRLAGWLGTGELAVSCFHHQRIGRLATGLRAVAVAEDGTIEAAELPGRPGYGAAVQWHPEDTAGTDPANAALFGALVDAAAAHRSAKAT
jgi:putative glutamine amidotransferase